VDEQYREAFSAYCFKGKPDHLERDVPIKPLFQLLRKDRSETSKEVDRSRSPFHNDFQKETVTSTYWI